jgi:N utilization substance protein B
MKPRTRARSVALQVLYEIDIIGHAPGVILQERFDALQEEKAPLDDDLANFVINIVNGVYPNIKLLDETISRHAPEWPLDQVATIDRNILRIALWEIAMDRQTPVKVAINEAVELAKMFGSDSSARFVNGVLGSLATSLNEIIQSLNKPK